MSAQDNDASVDDADDAIDAVSDGDDDKPVDLDALEALYKKTSPGPWGEDDCNIFSCPLADARHNAIIAKIEGKPFNKDALHLDGFVATTEQRHEQSDDDAAFITAIANAAPKLFAELRAARALLGDAEGSAVEEVWLSRIWANSGISYKRLVLVASHALVNALDARDFMGRQLAHAHGEIDDATYQSFENDFFEGGVYAWKEGELRAFFEVLDKLCPGIIDADALSVLTHCDMRDAMAVVHPQPQPKEP